ncbi:DUF2871 domain-containing protein [Clostridium sp. MSJ-4]|uniref:DUF2871 domain-containing protein n=1 Tax=Clostridium simiarum TaxID=2841506 RepID=A0ABS6F5X5_9CLOT|nr:DUF2871 domain-containing protein [Clostridium simiarum]MBU5592988.1 DUF2871 domain-containing protein [Clostridium simiarum]
MKKLINTAFIYAIAAMFCGVFYRELTKFMAFEGRTTLAFTHLHLLVLGTVIFLVLALFSIQTDLLEQKRFKTFFTVYNIGLPMMVGMFFVRGILQVMGTTLSSGMNAAISGIAGVTHIILASAIVLLFLCLRKSSVKSA